jgi:hypothetical protein
MKVSVIGFRYSRRLKKKAGPDFINAGIVNSAAHAICPPSLKRILQRSNATSSEIASVNTFLLDGAKSSFVTG